MRTGRRGDPGIEFREKGLRTVHEIANAERSRNLMNVASLMCYCLQQICAGRIVFRAFFFVCLLLSHWPPLLYPPILPLRKLASLFVLAELAAVNFPDGSAKIFTRHLGIPQLGTWRAAGKGKVKPDVLRLTSSHETHFLPRL